MGIDLSWVSGRRILVVDDDEATLQLVTKYFQRSMPNCETRQASNGLEGLALAQQWKPHVVFTDISMPNMDGLELLMRLHMELPQTQVVVFTGREDQETWSQALIHGVTDYIHKPLEMQELLLTCKRAIDRLELVEGLEKQIAELEGKLAERNAEVLKLDQELKILKLNQELKGAS